MTGDLHTDHGGCAALARQRAQEGDYRGALEAIDQAIATVTPAATGRAAFRDVWVEYLQARWLLHLDPVDSADTFSAALGRMALLGGAAVGIMTCAVMGTWLIRRLVGEDAG